jgi:hypothetical protein
LKRDKNDRAGGYQSGIVVGISVPAGVVVVAPTNPLVVEEGEANQMVAEVEANATWV